MGCTCIGSSANRGDDEDRAKVTLGEGESEDEGEGEDGKGRAWMDPDLNHDHDHDPILTLRFQLRRVGRLTLLWRRIWHLGGRSGPTPGGQVRAQERGGPRGGGQGPD